MKRCILITLFLSFFGFSSALAYDPPYPLPYTYNGITYNYYFEYKLPSYGFGQIYYYTGSCGSPYEYPRNPRYYSGEVGICGDAFIVCTYYNDGPCGSWTESSGSFGMSTLVEGTSNTHSSKDIVSVYADCGVDNVNGCPVWMTADVAPAPATLQLNITRSPEVGGGVSDYPAGENIYCGIDSYEICEASFPLNTEVTLDASPNEGYALAYWELNSEVCASAVENQLDVVMSENTDVNAVFYLKADDFVFPVLAQGVTNPLLNKFNPIGDGWNGPGVGEYSAAAGHLGQDYVMNYNNGDGNAAGEPVYAVANGTIVEVINNQNTLYGWCNDSDHGWGPVVVIRHENRDGFGTTGSIVTTSCDTETNPTVIYSLYGHLSKTNIQNLQIGQTVHMGDQLGVVGAYGVDQSSWTTNHLHFELKDEVGYAEGVWYKTPANEGVCPESTSYPCDSYLVKGVGTAYSMGINFAPHRYEPGAFINLNKR